MTFAPRPTHLLLRCLLACAALSACGCDRGPTPPARAPTSRAVAAVGPGTDAYQVKLAALRHLIEDQPLAADQVAYAAYLIKENTDDAVVMADTLSLALAGRAPPVVASRDGQFYRRRGRTMDRETGRPVKVFQARVIDLKDPPDNSAAAPEADVRASWQAGRLAGGTYTYRLRKDAGAWRVLGRTVE